MEAGNVKAMREALKHIVSLLRSDTFVVLSPSAVEIIEKILLASEAALSAPPRNCDVGTAEEQRKRFKAFCRDRQGGTCDKCPARKGFCTLTWAQMPYKEGGEG